MNSTGSAGTGYPGGYGGQIGQLLGGNRAANPFQAAMGNPFRGQWPYSTPGTPRVPRAPQSQFPAWASLFAQGQSPRFQTQRLTTTPQARPGRLATAPQPGAGTPTQPTQPPPARGAAALPGEINNAMKTLFALNPVGRRGGFARGRRRF